MEDLVESVTRGNVAEVKVLVATVAIALAVYQLVLIAVAYGKLRPPFLAWRPASAAHRAIGDTLVVLVVVVAFMCLAVYGFDDDGGVHAILGVAVIGALALKVGVVRVTGGSSRLLPLLGATVFTLLALTWAASAGGFLVDR